MFYPSFFKQQGTPNFWGVHNFFILVQNQLLLRPTNALAQWATNLLEDHDQKMAGY
jgi:hypothetical protein